MSLKLSIEALEVIDAIARKGSFAAAAESLFRVPSALTYTIKKLEDDLGITLFDRSGHRATLTPAGAELLKEGRHLLGAAQALESRIKRIATGVETELCIAYSDLFSEIPLFQMLHEFYVQGFGTRIKLMREVYGGSWDALQTGRSDISIGAPGESPPQGSYATHLLGQMEFVFAVASTHPLAAYPEPLSSQDIIQFRAVAAADSSRNLPPRTSGILSGQDTLTVTDIVTKLQAQIMGLGVGYLPTKMAVDAEQKGQLVIKKVSEPKPTAPIFLAWHPPKPNEPAKAKHWLIKRLTQLSLDELLI